MIIREYNTPWDQDDDGFYESVQERVLKYISSGTMTIVTSLWPPDKLKLLYNDTERTK